ncbi:MAG: hypothetical protein HY704_01575 [Gemmatimonadetes bacterium]|nr:hypothetical protein [Gemmatimonadota bacterium]
MSSSSPGNGGGGDAPDSRRRSPVRDSVFLAWLVIVYLFFFLQFLDHLDLVRQAIRMLL